MADITMCEGQDCPLKLSCYRYNAPKGMRQSYFMSPPFKDGECNHYWEDKEKQLIESKLRRCGSTSLFNIAIIEELFRNNKETFNTKEK